MTTRPHVARLIVLVGLILAGSGTALAQSPAASMVRLLESGRIPPERQATVIALICGRGDASDLGFVVTRLIDGSLADEARGRALVGLAEAVRGRGIVPEGDKSGWATLWSEDRPTAERLAAVELAGLWKEETLAKPLRDLALAEATPGSLRAAALSAWATAAPDQARTELTQAAQDGSAATRAQAVAALVPLDAAAAAKSGADLLVSSDDPKVAQIVIPPFLREQRGPSALASALTEREDELTEDAAKLAARTMLATGQNAPALSEVLLRAAGVDAERTWTQEEIRAIAAAAMSQGDPVRGEAIYRRPDLSCVKCHAISKAGGRIGPDLAAVGGTSPPDYIVSSILIPAQDVKEMFQMLKVLTYEGKSVQGLIIDRNEDRVILRDAEGRDQTLAVDDIEDEKEGGSLMPTGLTAFLTEQELYDLVRFVAELGKPGPYAITDSPAVRTWAVLRDVPESLKGLNTTGTALEQLENDADLWETLTARVDGTVPLSEADAMVGDGPLYLMAKVDVTKPGPVGLKVNDWSGLTVWFGGGDLPANATAGELRYDRRMSLFVRIDREQRATDELKIELLGQPDGAQFHAVDSLTR